MHIVVIQSGFTWNPINNGKIDENVSPHDIYHKHPTNVRENYAAFHFPLEMSQQKNIQTATATRCYRPTSILYGFICDFLWKPFKRLVLHAMHVKYSTCVTYNTVDEYPSHIFHNEIAP